MNSTLIKILAIAAILAALYAGYKYEMNRSFEAGKNETLVAVHKEYHRQLNVKEEKNKKTLDELQKINDKYALLASEKQKVKIIERIQYVKRTIDEEAFVCVDLGHNFIRVLNKNRRYIFTGDDNE